MEGTSTTNHQMNPGDLIHIENLADFECNVIIISFYVAINYSKKSYLCVLIRGH